jgi:hypothetical protein
MNERKILAKALNSPHNVRFDEMVALVKAFGFTLSRVKGSHHVFDHDQVPRPLNLQERGGKAKAYQVRQFIRLIERYDLKLGGDE